MPLIEQHCAEHDEAGWLRRQPACSSAEDQELLLLLLRALARLAEPSGHV
jgi:hypothetical protein